MVTRAEYLSQFQSPADAAEFESQVLDLEGQSLPAFAKVARDKSAEPSSEYWAWLLEHLERLQLGEHEE
ncbi:MAG TPA: hypothetical protein VFQ61_39005 [Polyangiaceae bacterium]|nr:hypothetical protein [Polyangiaceae bacterium]